MTDLNYWILLVVLTSALLIQWLQIRKNVQSFFDPMVYFVVSTSFALTFSVLLVDDASTVYKTIFYFVSFWIGYRLVPLRKIENNRAELMYFKVEPIFTVLCLLSGGVYFVLNFYAFSKTGIPLFSENPSLDKVESLTGGLGLVRRYNWGMGIFALAGMLYWWLGSRSRIAAVGVTIICVMSILGGGKSALLPLLFALGLFVHRPFLDQQGRDMSRTIKRMTPWLLAAAFFPVIVVLLREADDAANAAAAFATRLLYFGDSLYYWGNSDLRRHFHAIYGPLNYPEHVLGSLLGLARLAEYQTSIGSQFVQFSLKFGEELSTSLGPNTPFYVKGELFFGQFFAFLYCVSIGSVVGFIRLKFERQIFTSMTRYSLSATFVVIGMTLPTEDALFVGRIFDLLIFLMPIYIASKIVILGSRRQMV